MADDDGRISGSDGAHTLGDPERAAKVGATRAMAEAAMDGLADRLAEGAPDDAQPSLLLADPDGEFCLFGGPVRHVAKIRDDAKRARGRPAGSKNRRSDDLANYLLSMGYRDPALNLADLANSDPLHLAAELSQPYTPKTGRRAGELVEESVTPGQAMKLIMDANEALMKYFHAAKPQQVEVKASVMGVMVIGELKSEQQQDGKVMDMTRFDPPE